jgi:hypothetical protein
VPQLSSAPVPTPRHVGAALESGDAPAYRASRSRARSIVRYPRRSSTSKLANCERWGLPGGTRMPESLGASPAAGAVSHDLAR